MVKFRLQSAMEYLMTYGWAILVVAVVLGAMFALGVFSSGGTVSNSCLSTAGYLCQNPVLNSTGWLGIKFGWIGAFPITLTNIACTIGNAAPVSTQSVNVQLQSGSTVNLAFLCPLVSNGIGSSFSGVLWVIYNTQTQTGVEDKLGVVTAKVSSASANVIAAEGGGSSAGGTTTTSTSTTSTTSTSTTSTTSTSTTSTTTTSTTSTVEYAYCVGGYNSGGLSNVYYAPLYANGALGAWAATNSYPETIVGEACMPYNGKAYCIDGSPTGGGGQGVISYYAPLLNPGVGTWAWTGNNFPVPNIQGACVSSGGYIDCIAGYSGSPFPYAYYAGILSTGTTAWGSSTQYPLSVYTQPCVVSGGYVYCVGGANSYTNAVYYAQLNGGGGTGAWSSTTSYPIGIAGNSCVVSGGYVYCVGGYSGGNTGAAYYGQISNPGVASWSSTSAYPIADNFDNPSECFQYNGYMYCVGGYTGSAISQVYYAPLTSGGIGSWIASANSYPIPNYATSCFAP